MNNQAHFDFLSAALRKEGRVRLKFSGSSMTPTLREGMEILAEKILSSAVRAGDIILYRNRHTIVGHRVVKVLKQQDKRIFVTKGDNHAYMDAAFIAEDDFLGVVRAAFLEDDPKRNVLINYRLVRQLYAIMDNLSLFLKKRGKVVPCSMRRFFKPLIDAFFITFKKLIHFFYLGINHGYLLLGRVRDTNKRFKV